MTEQTEAMAEREPWMTSYGATPMTKHDTDYIVTTVAAKVFQLYRHEARYLRDLLDAALQQAGGAVHQAARQDAPRDAPEDEGPVAWLRFRAGQTASPDGNVESDEWLEVCEPGQIGDDGRPAQPVFAHPAAPLAGEASRLLEQGSASTQAEDDDDFTVDGHCTTCGQMWAGTL